MNPNSTMGGAAIPCGLGKAPEIAKPQVGETLMLSINNYGSVFLVKPEQAIFDGQEYFEVEVKAIKKAKVSFE